MNRRTYLIILFTLLTCRQSAQERPPAVWSLQASSGISDVATSDALINYYRYQKRVSAIFQVGIQRQTHNQVAFLTVTFNPSELNPCNIEPAFYEYNRVQYQMFSLILGVLKKTELGNHIQVGYGFNNQSYRIDLIEKYKSLLYDYAYGVRHSFDMSLINLSPQLSIKVHLNNHTLTWTGYTSLLALNGRADDNYVKGYSFPKGIHWNWYSCKQYQLGNMALSYSCKLFGSWNFETEFSLFHLTHKTNDPFRYFRKSLTVGVRKVI